ncbi:MAG TPA: hypothetical protein VD860_09655 [Azospirillum sp.]|nr:hypothetical protein [Azospirillum sp.]
MSHAPVSFPAPDDVHLLFHPPFPDADSLHRCFIELAWHYRGVSALVSSVTFSCVFQPAPRFVDTLTDGGAPIDDATDPAVLDLLGRWRGKLHVHHRDEVPLPPGPRQVLVWKPDPGTVREGEELSNGGRCIALEPAPVRNGGGARPEPGFPATADFLLAAWQADPGRIRHVRRSQSRFEAMCRRFGRGREVFLVGLGPSIDQAPFPPAGSVTIVCNNIVFKTGFLRALRPDILAIYDDDLLGLRSWTARFRRALADTMAQFEDLILVTPVAYVPFLEELLPETQHRRLLGIPFTMERRVDGDLSKEYWLNSTNNVLTTLMLPLARLFASGGGAINLMGCDGRPWDADALDWAHAGGTENQSRRDWERQANLVFLPYDQREVMLHYLWLDRQVAALEQSGIPVRSLTPSHIPCLASRFHHG